MTTRQAAEQDYSFTGLSADLGAGFSATYGSFGQDFAGAYFEADYGFSVAELDFGVSLIFPDDDIAAEDGEAPFSLLGKASSPPLSFNNRSKGLLGGLFLLQKNSSDYSMP